MALIKHVRQADGRETNYHKISRVSCSFSDNSVNIIITVYSFNSKAAREDDEENWNRCRNYYAHVSYDEYNKFDGDLRKFAYNRLKTLDDFIGSKDD